MSDLHRILFFENVVQFNIILTILFSLIINDKEISWAKRVLKNWKLIAAECLAVSGSFREGVLGYLKVGLHLHVQAGPSDMIPCPFDAHLVC